VKDTAASPLGSVVVTTKNEELKIASCLRSIQEQSYSPIEIIVVDNASTDRTKEIAREFTDKVFDHGPERSAQRNLGILDVAHGKYAMYVDADMILSPDLIETSVSRMSPGDCVALHISEVVLGRGFFSRVRRFERSFYDGTVIDAARFFRRDVFCEAGGFDETMTGVEDWDLDKKIKQMGQIALLDIRRQAIVRKEKWEFDAFIRQRGVEPHAYGPVVFHDESEFRVIEYLRKKSYYSNWFARYTRKWGPGDSDVQMQLGFRYRFFTVFVEDRKWRKLATRPMLTLGILFLRILVGGAYLTRRLAHQDSFMGTGPSIDRPQ